MLEFFAVMGEGDFVGGEESGSTFERSYISAARIIGLCFVGTIDS